MTSGIGGSTAQAELAAIEPWRHPAPRDLLTPPSGPSGMARAQALMAEIGADALIIGAGPSLRYFTGVGWNATERLVAMILPREGEPAHDLPAFRAGFAGGVAAASRPRSRLLGRAREAI